MEKLNNKLLDSLKKICKEWERQKNLFPVLNRDGWMDAEILNAKSLIQNIEDENKQNDPSINDVIEH